MGSGELREDHQDKPRTRLARRERHDEMVRLSGQGLTLNQIAIAVQRQYGGRVKHHSIVLYHVNGKCQCYD